MGFGVSVATAPSNGSASISLIKRAETASDQRRGGARGAGRSPPLSVRAPPRECLPALCDQNGLRAPAREQGRRIVSRQPLHGRGDLGLMPAR